LVVVSDKFDVTFFSESGVFNRSSSIQSNSGNPIASKIYQMSSGPIVVSGTSNNKMALLKLDPNSNPLELNAPSELVSGSARSLVVDSANQILLAGSSGNQLAVLRLQANSLDQLDSNFGRAGVLLDNVSTQANDLVLDSVGRILVAGTSSNQMLIRRYQSNGSFIDDGNHSKNISFTGATPSVANRITLDGVKIVLGGKAGARQAMARLQP